MMRFDRLKAQRDRRAWAEEKVVLRSLGKSNLRQI